MYGSFTNTEGQLVVIREGNLWKKIAFYAPELWGSLSRTCKAINKTLSYKSDRRKMWNKHLVLKTTEKGNIKIMWNGKLHNPFGPALISSYYKLGKLHRRDGPAHIIGGERRWLHRGDKFQGKLIKDYQMVTMPFVKEWWINGKYMTDKQMWINGEYVERRRRKKRRRKKHTFI